MDVRLRLVPLFFLLALIVPCTVGAQGRSDVPSVSSEDAFRAGAFNEEAIRAVLSELDDKEVRALLIERLTAEAERQAAEANQRALSDVLAAGAANFGLFIADVIAKAPNLPGEISAAFATFAERRGDTPLWRFTATLFGALCLGAVAALLLARIAPGRRALSTTAGQAGPISHGRTLAVRFMLHLSLVAAFAFFALSLNAWLNARYPTDRQSVVAVVAALSWLGASIAVARFFLAPSRADLRLVAIGDRDARALLRRTVGVAAIFTLGFGFTGWLHAMDSVYADSWHGFWVNTLGHVALGVALWRSRGPLRRILSGEALGTAAEPPLYRAWPAIAVALVALHWLVIEIVVANASVPANLWTAMAITLILLLALPFLDQALAAAVRAFVSGGNDHETDVSPVLAAAHEQTRRGTLRIARVLGAIVLVLTILAAWDVNLVSVAERGVGAEFGADLIGALMIVGVAYVAWEGVRVVIARQIAMERAALGLGAQANGDAPEGEGGGAGARLGTLLPLVRVSATVAIAVMAILTLLGQFGVNVLPLVAGAGVVGLAIGFGAQTLVRDIVSGIFFLIDDAFRLGEYIDLGDTRGTVERISVRSMQLRHHRGVLNTIPFGEIRHVANLSRDWVIMKFPLRLPYGTDTEKVRKMVKKLGQDLLDHPEYGHQFLQPLKSQGVVEMEDSYMIVPVKFMARPGEQWMLRRLVLTKIHELFEENGIRFASREVVVRLGDHERNDEMTQAEREAAGGAAARLIRDEAQSV